MQERPRESKSKRLDRLRAELSKYTHDERKIERELGPMQRRCDRLRDELEAITSKRMQLLGEISSVENGHPSEPVGVGT